MTVTPILTRALRYGGIFALAVAVVAGVIGLLVAGVPGLVGGLLGAVMAAVFLGLTAGSMLFAGRLTKGDPGSPLFFGIVLGVWLLKLILFVVVAILLRGQSWLNPLVFFAAVIVAVMGSLILDVVAFYRARVPYVSDVTLPGEMGPTDGSKPVS
jgi:hypothetical protein